MCDEVMIWNTKEAATNIDGDVRKLGNVAQDAHKWDSFWHDTIVVSCDRFSSLLTANERHGRESYSKNESKIQ